MQRPADTGKTIVGASRPVHRPRHLLVRVGASEHPSVRRASLRPYDDHDEEGTWNR